jgi:hypothetical protein
MYLRFIPVLFALLFALSHASPALISTNDTQSLLPIPPSYRTQSLFPRQLTNLQTFTSALGSTPASPITNSGDAKRPFSVDGQTFDKFESAAQRSCDNQSQGCQREANDKKEFTVGECDEQKGRSTCPDLFLFGDGGGDLYANALVCVKNRAVQDLPTKCSSAGFRDGGGGGGGGGGAEYGF